MINIEIKYRISQPGSLRATLQADEETEFGFSKSQVDTYFNCSSGRLKLREQEDSTPHLIEYVRPDQATARISSFSITELGDVEAARNELSLKHGVHAIVRKHRELYFYRNVRIHLDTVDSLGSFLEFESVISDTCDHATAQKHLDQISQKFTRYLDEPVSVGYVDLLTKDQE